MTYLQLFISFFQIGLFSIGGGYAALPLIQEQVVNLHGWMDMTQFIDIITISQMTPGPIAINAATFVGIKTAGIGGAIVATVGCVTPSCIIVLVLAAVYYRFRNLHTIKGVLSGLRPAVVALIASAGLSIVIVTFLRTAWYSLQRTISILWLWFSLPSAFLSSGNSSSIPFMSCWDAGSLAWAYMRRLILYDKHVLIL